MPRAVNNGYTVDVPIDTPWGAAITAVFMTLIVTTILNYFYHLLKERSANASATGQSH